MSKQGYHLFRQPTVTRITLNQELERQFERLRQRGAGVVLDVGAKHAPYRDAIGATEYLTLDVDPSCEPDLCCDLHHVDRPDASFDAIIATEVLEHLYAPDRAVEEIRRLLTPRGVCIVSTRFIYEYHPDPQDYFRFSRDGLQYLFRNFTHIEIIPHGNRLQAIWQLIAGSKRTLGLVSWLNPAVARIRQAKTRCPLGFVVWAER